MYRARSGRGEPSCALSRLIPNRQHDILAFCARKRINNQPKVDKISHDMIPHQLVAEVRPRRADVTRVGVRFYPAKKADRLTGWAIMRRMLADAGKPDVPRLYVAHTCTYFWETVPYLGHDAMRVEDVDRSGADHAADAVRHGCLRRSSLAQRVRVVGT